MGSNGPTQAPPSQWPEGLTRVPYWAFQREDVYAQEQTRIFQGPSWSFLCLESDVANPGDWRSTFVGDAPVVVTRNASGEIHAFENRCAHRGSLICLDDKGKAAKGFSCVYHAWSYNLEGDLTGVAFAKGVKGKGGMSPDFKISEHGPRKLRVETISGLVYGTFAAGAPSLPDYLGEEIATRIARVFRDRKPVVLGRFTQALPNNWKLYIENVKDSYHASILHLFFTTFELNRLSQKGAIIVDESYCVGAGNGNDELSQHAHLITHRRARWIRQRLVTGRSQTAGGKLRPAVEPVQGKRQRLQHPRQRHAHVPRAKHQHRARHHAKALHHRKSHAGARIARG